jgi:hypothetical protein
MKEYRFVLVTNEVLYYHKEIHIFKKFARQFENLRKGVLKDTGSNRLTSLFLFMPIKVIPEISQSCKHQKQNGGYA